jgi:hypothetical protein
MTSALMRPETNPQECEAMTTDELKRAEARYQRAQERAREAREERDATVQAALMQGWSQVGVARAMGLSPQRVGQLAQGLERVYVVQS